MTDKSKKVLRDELARLQVELVKLQEWVRTSGLKIVVIFERKGRGRQGWCHQAHHRDAEPPILQGRGSGDAHGAGEVPVVLPALCRPSPGRR